MERYIFGVATLLVVATLVGSVVLSRRDIVHDDARAAVPEPLSLGPSVTTPRAGDVVESPLTVAGSAPQSWYFLGSFPIMLSDKDGEIITVGIASAQSPPRESETVPFAAVLSFASTSSLQGVLNLLAADPSGTSDGKPRLAVPVRFGEAPHAQGLHVDEDDVSS